MNGIDSTILDAPVYKRIDDPWIALLVLSILIFVVSGIAIIVLYIVWRRYRQLTKVTNESYILSNKPTGRRQIPIQIQDQPPKFYEPQNMDTFIPPRDDIQQARHMYERTTKAYF